MLDIKDLKNSKNQKYRKIYEKAMRIRSSGVHKGLSEKDVLELEPRFPQLRLKVVMGGDIIVRSKKDTWMIRDEEGFISLHHKGTIISKGKIKDVYHLQDVFYDLEFALASIVSHDEYAIAQINRSILGIHSIVEESKKYNEQRPSKENY